MNLKGKGPQRDRWMSRPIFVTACIGSAIGLGNIWKFPYLTFKHGGINFIVAYIIALMIIALPMLILELTLGQKMQKGSAGSLRGIVPRLGGIGWVASIAGFISAILYNILLGLALWYMIKGNSTPWETTVDQRSIACQTAFTSQTSAASIYLYQTVLKYFSEQTCMPVKYGESPSVFAMDLFIMVVITWIICFLCIIKGPKTSGYVVMATVPLPFLLLVVNMVYYVGLNNANSGKGLRWYFNQEPFPLPAPDAKGNLYYDPASKGDELMRDAVNQAFFSVGVCVGVYFAYASFNDLKKPVIADAFAIAFVDLLFSILAGFVAWSVLGFLETQNNLAYNQTSSIGLALIAFPTAVKLDPSGKPMFILFMLCLFVAGIDSAFSYIEAIVTNIVDHYRCPRWKAALPVCIFGILLSATFTSNYGWLLFDIVDHYTGDYIYIIVGLAQCVSVGWLFEYDTTAIVSPQHQKSMLVMTLSYWISVVTFCFYANFGFTNNPQAGIICIFVFSIIGLLMSWRYSEMSWASWYHEILFCGVDKLSMSITSLSNEDGSRSWWMLYFEFWFGMTIKFIAPAILSWMLLSNIKGDIKSEYGSYGGEMLAFGSIYLFICLLVIVIPLFICDWPEKFFHNVNLEFQADQIYSDALKNGGNKVTSETEMKAKE